MLGECWDFKLTGALLACITCCLCPYFTDSRWQQVIHHGIKIRYFYWVLCISYLCFLKQIVNIPIQTLIFLHEHHFTILSLLFTAWAVGRLLLTYSVHALKVYMRYTVHAAQVYVLAKSHPHSRLLFRMVQLNYKLVWGNWKLME